MLTEHHFGWEAATVADPPGRGALASVLAANGIQHVGGPGVHVRSVANQSSHVPSMCDGRLEGKGPPVFRRRHNCNLGHDGFIRLEELVEDAEEPTFPEQDQAVQTRFVNGRVPTTGAVRSEPLDLRSAAQLEPARP